MTGLWRKADISKKTSGAMMLVRGGLKISLFSFLCAGIFSQLDSEIDIVDNSSSSSSSNLKESAIGKIPQE